MIHHPHLSGTLHTASAGRAETSVAKVTLTSHRRDGLRNVPTANVPAFASETKAYHKNRAFQLTFENGIFLSTTAPDCVFDPALGKQSANTEH